MRKISKQNGFTLIEILICLLVFSFILAGTATAINRAGKVSLYSHTDVSTRSSQNKLFNEFNIAIDSLIAYKDTDYATVTAGGIVAEDIVSDESVIVDGVNYRKIQAHKVTMYMKGEVQKRILSIETDEIQDKAPIYLSGRLRDTSYYFDFHNDGSVSGERLKEETLTSCVVYTSAGEDNYESYFELLVDDEDILHQITFSLTLPKHEYQVKHAIITQSCPQEVKVLCVP